MWNATRGTLVTVAGIVISVPVGAQDEPVVARFRQMIVEAPTAPPLYQEFGARVALEDGLLAVGEAPLAGGGPVRLFRKGAHVWDQVQVLDAPAEVGRYSFGWTLALDQDRLAVGAREANVSGLQSGAVVVYRDHDGDDQFELEQVLAPPPGDYLWAGSSICLEGDRLLVGASEYAPGHTGTGFALVYDYIGGAWVLSATLEPPGLQVGDRFGSAVALKGDLAVAGSYFRDAGHSNAGAAFVFREVGSGWELDQVLESPQTHPNGWFGRALDLDGELLAIGEPGRNRVHLYRPVGDSWTHSATLTASGATGYGWVGYDLDLEEDLLAVGAPLSSGRLFLFQELAGAWVRAADLRHPDLADWDQLGLTVAVDAGQRALVAGVASFADHGVVLAYDLADAVLAFCFGQAELCPCGNAGGLQEGCGNSGGAGGRLETSGSHSVALDDLAFQALGLVVNQPALLFVGTETTAGGAGVPFGDGLRCAAGSVVRLGVRAPDGAGVAVWDGGLSTQGGWSGGDVRAFQVWYRDPGGSPCGSGFNLTHGLRVEFVP